MKHLGVQETKGESLRYTVKFTRIRNKHKWKIGQPQGRPEKCRRVRVDHKWLITVHAGLVFICEGQR